MGSYRISGDTSFVKELSQAEMEFVRLALELTGVSHVTVFTQDSVHKFVLIFDELDYDADMDRTRECLRFFKEKRMTRPVLMLLRKGEIDETLISRMASTRVGAHFFSINEFYWSRFYMTRGAENALKSFYWGDSKRLNAMKD